MKIHVRSAEEYAKFIVNDEREKINKETPTVYTADRIERVYEFCDGAVVKYEWQNLSGEFADEQYNHRFTLVKPPSNNSNKLKTGIIKVINY